MKFLLLALFLAANLVSAADIKLANGRVIRDGTVITKILVRLRRLRQRGAWLT